MTQNFLKERPTLIVVTGATASGKSDLAIRLAETLGCEIISADSRQIYKDMPVGTAAPSPEDLARVPHHFIQCLAPGEYYSAAQFEHDVLELLPDLWKKSPYAILCGGSMMYIDAVTDGIDDLPTISDQVRDRVLGMLHSGGGVDAVFAYLELLDPAYAAEVDRANPRRVAHAVEICLEAGIPYSQLRRNNRVERPFNIIKVALDMPRAELFDRINRRVEVMMERGLLDEVKALMPFRHENALNSVGYKELYAYLDGKMDYETAVARIAKNTRVYAKKQLTWLARPGVRPTVFLKPETALEEILSLLGRGPVEPVEQTPDQ